MQKILTLLLFPLLLLEHSKASAHRSGDTLYTTLQQAETRLLQQNLALLAAHYDVDINKALAAQARYLDNPVLNTDQTLYDGKFFRHTTKDGVRYGEIFIQLQQLIRTAGKRNKQIQLANDATLSAQEQLNDLMRNLRWVVESTFFTLHQLIQVQTVYSNEVSALQQLVAGMDAQLKAGNISEKDNVRVKALLYALQADITNNQRQIEDSQKDLRLLLQTGLDTFYVPLVPETIPNFDAILKTPVAVLLDSALNNRPDRRLTALNLATQNHNLRYQKALAVPDVTTGIEYDRLNSYVPNYYGLAISVPIPLFNRNKGNIKAAELQVKQSSVAIQQMDNQLTQEVAAAYNKFLATARLTGAEAPDLKNRYNQLLKNMLQSYLSRQVNLVEFIDFFESYKETTLKYFEQEANLNLSIGEINYVTGTKLF